MTLTSLPRVCVALCFLSGPALSSASEFRDGRPAANPGADMSVALNGPAVGSGQITSLSAASLARGAYLEVFGQNFGGAGSVLVSGFAAPIASWSDTRIAVYVPEAAPQGVVDVRVVTADGVSNAVPFNVTLRSATGRVLWRLRMEGMYSMVRPVVARDRTVYAIDISGRLYAVAPDGAVKWIVREAGDKGLAVGPDGTIYTGSETDVKAFRPDGTRMWTYVFNPRSFILVAIAVGPDGNLYGVSSSGVGVFSLTPAGTVRWTTPEEYDRPIVEYGDIVFGPNAGATQLYFYANNHTRAVRIDNGASVFTRSNRGQPVVSPADGTFHQGASAFSPGGGLLWTFSFPVSSQSISAADLGADGTHYVTHRSVNVYAIDVAGRQKWQATLPLSVGPPNVDPTNALIVFSGVSTLDHPGFLQAISTSAQDLWKVDLPAEEASVFNPWTAQYGFNQFASSRPTFTHDGSTVYVVTAIATGGLVRDRSFLYSIDTGNPALPPPAPLPAMRAQIALTTSPHPSGIAVQGRVTIRTGTRRVQYAAVGITWMRPNGRTVKLTATTNVNGVAVFTIRGPVGIYTLRIDSVVKSGSAFDAAGSVLMRSITP